MKNKFFNNLVNLFSSTIKFLANFGRGHKNPNPVVVSHKEAMAKKDALAKVTFWKKVMKRRMRKGRAYRKPTRKYRKALAQL